MKHQHWRGFPAYFGLQAAPVLEFTKGILSPSGAGCFGKP